MMYVPGIQYETEARKTSERPMRERINENQADNGGSGIMITRGDQPGSPSHHHRKGMAIPRIFFDQSKTNLKTICSLSQLTEPWAAVLLCAAMPKFRSRMMNCVGVVSQPSPPPTMNRRVISDMSAKWLGLFSSASSRLWPCCIFCLMALARWSTAYLTTQRRDTAMIAESFGVKFA